MTKQQKALRKLQKTAQQLKSSEALLLQLQRYDAATQILLAHDNVQIIIRDLERVESHL